MPSQPTLRDLNKLNTFVRVAERRKLHPRSPRPANDAVGRQQTHERA